MTKMGQIILGFSVGLLVSWILKRRWVRKIEAERRDLLNHLDSAEQLLSEKMVQLWPRMKPAQGTDTHMASFHCESSADTGSCEDLASYQTEDGTGEITNLQVAQLCGSLVKNVSGRSVDSENGRRIRITKVSGRANNIRIGVNFVGLEETPPTTGKNYRVYTEGGKVFMTTLVRKVSGNYIRTTNSIYEIQVLG